MGFSIFVWNVRNFRGSSSRLSKVVNTIKWANPDVLGLLEFREKPSVRELIASALPKYSFGVTESSVGLEILVGWKLDKFAQTIFTQRRDLQVGSVSLRPGAVLTVRQKRTFYNLLFVHLDSGRSSRDYGNRQKMIRKIWRLEKVLQRIPQQRGRSNLIALGDFNTMGCTRPNVSAAREMSRFRESAKRNGMKLLSKEHLNTWHPHRVWVNGRPRSVRTRDLGRLANRTSNLDHIIAAQSLQFYDWTRAGSSITAEVLVEGWNQLQGRYRADFLRNISDHSALFAELY